MQRLRSEQGVALVIAMGVLLVLGILAVGVLAVSLNANTQTRLDRDKTKALAAAENGLRIGLYNLNQSLPITDAQCPAQSDPTQHATGSGTPISCLSPTTPYTVTTPDGTTTTSYYISGGATNTALKCAGGQPTQQAGRSLTYRQRCITATGTSGNVTRRVQTRVLSVSYIFPIPGILATDHITLGTGTPTGTGLPAATCSSDVNTILAGGTITGTMLVEGSMGTNGTAKTVLDCWGGDVSDATTGVNSSHMYLGTGAPTTNGSLTNPAIYKAQPGSIERLTTSLEVPQVDTIFQDGMGGDSSTANNNSHISLVGCADGTYTADTRTINMGNSGTCVISLPGSTDINNPLIYNFCDVTYPTGNGGTIQLPVTATDGYVRLLIDSPSRITGTGTPACVPTTTGGLALKNGVGLLANASNAVGAQIFVYGNKSVAAGTGVNAISWANSGNLKTLIVAPRALLTFQNGAIITGGIAAWGVESGNNLVYLWDQRVDQVERRALYYRVSYTECAPTASSATDPTSGC